MKKLTQNERVEIASQVLNYLVDKDSSIVEMVEKLNHNKLSLTTVCRKLSKANLIDLKLIRGKLDCRLLKKDFNVNMIRKALKFTPFNEPIPTVCKDCDEKKIRILLEDGRHVSEDGRIWKNEHCPDCIAYWNSKAEPIEMTTRKCRCCSAFLPKSRYFHCFDCASALPSVDDDFIYVGEDEGDWEDWRHEFWESDPNFLSRAKEGANEVDQS